MKANDVERYRGTLLEMIRRLRGEVRDIRDAALSAASSHASVGNVEAVPGDSADMSVDQLRQDTEIALHENERQLLEQVDAALDRIRDGTFGVCSNCGKPIAAERLEAVPYTPYCLGCARSQEEPKVPTHSGL